MDFDIRLTYHDLDQGSLPSEPLLLDGIVPEHPNMYRRYQENEANVWVRSDHRQHDFTKSHAVRRPNRSQIIGGTLGERVDIFIGFDVFLDLAIALVEIARPRGEGLPFFEAIDPLRLADSLQVERNSQRLPKDVRVEEVAVRQMGPDPTVHTG